MSEEIKEKLITLWKQTCETTSKPLRTGFSTGFDKIGIDNYAKYPDAFLAKDFGVKENMVNAYLLSYLYHQFDTSPTLILQCFRFHISGRVKLTEKLIPKKLFRLIPYNKKQTVIDEEDRALILEKLKAQHIEIKITESGSSIGEITSDVYYSAVLIFGNLKCYISPELRKELIQMYNDANKRVDMELMEKRIKETSI